MKPSSTKIIQERYSCRKYEKEPISAEDQADLKVILDQVKPPPFGTQIRLQLTAAEVDDRTALRGLGTYGLIRNPAGFIIAAAEDTTTMPEDTGYVIEKVILAATAMGLGTCWLGGTFTKSAFAKRISLAKDEVIPAVVAIGYPEAGSRETDIFRKQVRGDKRLPFESLFFEENFGKAFTNLDEAHRTALEMVRIGPSASNKQPWRVIKDGQEWHFYCERTPGYGRGSLSFNLMRLIDLQRLDIGIAMAHFELALTEQGVSGHWENQNDPGLSADPKNCVYVASWRE